MTDPASAFSSGVVVDKVRGLPSSPSASWFYTRGGRRYGWEIGLVIVLKLALLVLLWFAFIKPWQRPATTLVPAAQQLYGPSAQAVRHD